MRLGAGWRERHPEKIPREKNPPPGLVVEVDAEGVVEGVLVLGFGEEGDG